MRCGFIGSFALHGLVLALIVLAWNQMPPASMQVVAVNLVRLSDRSTSPPSPQMAPSPQDTSGTVPQSDEAPVALAPIAAPLPQSLRPIQPSAPRVGMTQKLKRQTNNPGSVVTPTSSRPRTTVARTHPLSPNEQLAVRLKLLAGLRQPVRPTPHDVREPDGTGMSSMTAASADTVTGRNAAYAVKDIIRAQVERRWNLDRTRLGAPDWVVAIRIRFSPDGTVRRADIVANERFRSDHAYHDFALSARNAVLLSSPLTLPRGADTFATDIVVDFAARQVLQ